MDGQISTHWNWLLKQRQVVQWFLTLVPGNLQVTCHHGNDEAIPYFTETGQCGIITISDGKKTRIVCMALLVLTALATGVCGLGYRVYIYIWERQRERERRRWTEINLKIDFKNKGEEPLYDPVIPVLSIYPKEIKQHIKEINTSVIFTAVKTQNPSPIHSSKWSSTGEWVFKRGPCAQRNTIQPQRRFNLVIFDNPEFLLLIKIS